MPKKRKLNSKNPKYQTVKPKSETEKVEKKLMCVTHNGAKVYGIFKR